MGSIDAPHDLRLQRSFACSAACVLVTIVPLFCVFVRYGEVEGNGYFQHVQQYLAWFQAIEIMCLLGFGFLYAFLRRYSLSALGLTYFLSCLVMALAVLVVGAFQQVVWGGHSIIHLELPLMIESAVCAAGALIWFGAVIGKTSAAQLLWLAVLYVPLYAVNQHLVLKTLGALDVGASISLHAFAAWYGLAASLVVCRRQPRGVCGSSNPLLRSFYTSDVAGMIGVMLIWVYWPCFNGALATVPVESGAPLPPGVAPAQVAGQFYIVVNTWLSLLGATLSTFVTTALLGGRLDMVHVQNAGLAGGVVIGSSANLSISPGGALGLGVVGGVLATLGYARVACWLERRIGLTDTCGIHSLHAMPGVLGGLAAGVVAWAGGATLAEHTGAAQLAYQVLALLVAAGIGVAGGLLAGLLVTAWSPYPMCAAELFNDEFVWMHVVESMDHKGSVAHADSVDTGSMEDGMGGSARKPLARPN